MSKTSLFSKFDKVSSKQWKQKIQYDLKGADYNEVLVWDSLEGIKVKPFYHSEDLIGKPTFNLSNKNNWNIGQVIYCGNAELANEKAKDVLNRGASSLVLEIPEERMDWPVLLKEIDLKTTPLHFNFNFLNADIIKSLLEYFRGFQANLFLNIDIIGHLARSGNWYSSLQEDHTTLDEIVDLCQSQKSVSALCVDVSLYQNAGATIIQQLAYAMGHANEYLNHFSSRKKEIAPITFKVGVGTNYFFEVAKFRALRWLWHSLVKIYDMPIECHVLAQPSKRNKTLYDYNVNMLRTTSECMSAALGGADTICNVPYDALYHKENEFGDRIARNQLLLIKEESYFDEAVSAAEGSYFIESLTREMAEKALELFKQIEHSGGFLSQLKKGIVQKKIKASASKEQALFDSGELVLLGTNKFQNAEDRMKNTLELYPFVKTNKRKTLIEPIIERRLAEDLEKVRMETE